MSGFEEISEWIESNFDLTDFETFDELMAAVDDVFLGDNRDSASNILGDELSQMEDLFDEAKEQQEEERIEEEEAEELEQQQVDLEALKDEFEDATAERKAEIVDEAEDLASEIGSTADIDFIEDFDLEQERIKEGLTGLG